jgi:uncharacterized protein YbjQ (UPF0145 family)
MLAVTIDNLPGYEVREVIGEVIGIAARQQNVFTEGVKALSGTVSPQMPRTLRRWREDAIARMVESAYRRGANAVVGVRFDHRAIGSDWTELCAYGTAVLIVPARP